jgi:hypothetical protein
MKLRLSRWEENRLNVSENRMLRKCKNSGRNRKLEKIYDKT